MEEMDLLTSMRADVPLAPPSPAAERLFLAGLADDRHSERGRPIPSRPRFPPGVTGDRSWLRWWHRAGPGALAAGLVVALVVLLLPQHAVTPAAPTATDPVAGGTTVSAQLLADIAGQVGPPPAPGQAHAVGVPEDRDLFGPRAES
jgi:hypothetical protein